MAIMDIALNVYMYGQLAATLILMLWVMRG